ncbi:hypothetical protein D6817_04255 [Candidatus Pacearchaeota archaeon]|nr:MAG: hypothetical protein D6817_04255 [Candidatus Pacearchaeota archaeon]
MGLVEDVRQMQLAGMNENDIIQALKSKGVSESDISNAIAQAKIKSAVGGESAEESGGQTGGVPSPATSGASAGSGAVLPQPATAETTNPASEGVSTVQELSAPTNVPSPANPDPPSPQFEGMSPSMLSSSSASASEIMSPIPGQAAQGEQVPPQTQDPYPSTMAQTTQAPQDYAQAYDPYASAGAAQGYGQAEQYVGEPQAQATQDYGGYDYSAYGYDPYASYQDYQTYQAAGADILSEVVEQVVDEKLVTLRQALDKAIDFQNVAETKLQHLEERLKRIEQVIDKLQISLIQKVGEYVSDVMHLRKEVQETHKTLASELAKVKSGRERAGKSEGEKEKQAKEKGSSAEAKQGSSATFRSLASSRGNLP